MSDDRVEPEPDPRDDGSTTSPVREFRHIPVMLAEVVELFATVPGGLLVDATLGGAGHSEALLDARPDISLLGIDRDTEALAAAGDRLQRFGTRVQLHHGRYDELAQVVGSTGNEGVVGVLFDLGVSSPQLDRAERGFSFRLPAPLDMRMDRSAGRTAREIVNEYSADELASVLDRYGDERFSRRIAAAIVAARPVETTTELAEIISSAIPAPARRKSRVHPATRSFQALRIEINDELNVLTNALDQAIDLLLPGGRCVVLSYHSGEDRIVKERFRQAETGGCTCPPALGCACGAVPKVRLLNRGARKATAAEIEDNPRASSVRRRAVESVSFVPMTEATNPHEVA